MTDIEFILSEKFTLRKKAIYFWNTGFFQKNIKEKIYAYAQTKQIAVTQLETVSELLDMTQIPSLFGGQYYLVPLKEETEIPLLISGLNKLGEDDRILVFASVKFEEKFDKKDIQVLQEVKKNKNSFEDILKYVCSTTGFVLDQIPNIGRQSFDELYARCETIEDFVTKAEFALFSCLDGQSWNLPLFRNILPQITQQKYFKLHENLYFFLSNPTDSTKDVLFSYIDSEFSSQKDARSIINALFKALFDLIETNANLTKELHSDNFKIKFIHKFSHIPISNLLKTLLKLSEKSPELMSFDFLVYFENFLQDLLNYLKE